MGKEALCTMHYQGQAHSGRVYLESDYLLFRGDTRLKMQLDTLSSAAARNGVLTVRFEEQTAQFTIGEGAAAWAERITHPPSRMAKLGIKPGLPVSITGEMDADFLADLETAGATIAAPGKADAGFLAVRTASQLNKVAILTAKLQRCLWVVYPKGVTAIRETDVIAAGRDAGWKDTKVVAFSKTHTALRFSKPATSVGSE